MKLHFEIWVLNKISITLKIWHQDVIRCKLPVKIALAFFYRMRLIA